MALTKHNHYLHFQIELVTVTVSYIPTLEKYLMVVSTATYPSNHPN